jgi:DNA invertase Pin-like site-specific DNA recombinase
MTNVSGHPHQSFDPEFLEAWIEQHDFELERSDRPRAAVYARRSVTDAEDVSIGAQVDAAAAHCEAIEAVFDPRHMLFIDRHRSGANIDGREGLAALLSAAHGGAFDILVVREIDRLTRSVRDGAELVTQFVDLGIEVHRAGRGPIDQGQLVMLAFQAQWERLRIVDQFREGRRSSAAAGNLIGAWHSYGYDRIEGERGWTINTEQAAVIRQCFERIDGGLTRKAVVRALNAEGIPGPRGGLWSESSLYNQHRHGILQRPMLKGTFTYARHLARPIEVRVPELAIVEPELFDRVNARWTSPGGEVQPDEIDAAPSSRRSPSAGFVRCACGAPMGCWDGLDPPGSLLRCRDAALGKSCDRTRMMPKGEIARRVLQILRDELLDPERIPEWQRIRSQSWAEREQLLARRREVLDGELEHIDLDLNAHGDDGREARTPSALGQRGQLELRHHKLFRERAALEQPPLRDAMPEDGVRELRAAVARLMERLPLRKISDDDTTLIGRIVGLIPRIELETADGGEAYHLRFLVGIPGCPEDGDRRAPWPARRTCERTFPMPLAGPLRYPEVVVRQHRSAERGDFRLSDGEWRAISPLFDSSSGLGTDARMLAEGLIFAQSTSLWGRMLPERYFELADRISAARKIWPCVLEVLRARGSRLARELGLASPPVAKHLRLRRG